jgi:pimeloyl-ACP methyl ester carboxylesterase
VDGTAWRAIVPQVWGGVMISDADLTDSVSHAAFDKWCLGEGMAIVRTSREPAAWQVDRMLSNRHDVHELFTKRFGRPKTVVATGESLGGMVSRAIAERGHGLADAAVAMNGGGSGTIGLWNAKQDAAFAVRVLIADRDGAGRDGADLADSLAAADSSPAGRARATLAAALAMQPTWSDPDAPRPADDDLLAQAAAMRSSLGFGLAPSIRAEVERLAGGVFAGNEAVEYADLGCRLGRRRAVVDAVYERAGIRLEADLAALDAAPRITIDPAAVLWAERGAWSGELLMPLVTVYAIGDPAAVPEEEGAYHRTVERGGSTKRLEELYLDAAGHCRFTTGERAVAVERAMQLIDGQHIDSQVNPGSAKPDELNARAALIDAQQPTQRLAAFVEFEPEPYLRPHDLWDAAAAPAGLDA